MSMNVPSHSCTRTGGTGGTPGGGGGGGGGTPGGGGGAGGGMTLQHSGAAQVAPVHVILDAFDFCFIPAGHVYVKQTGLGVQHSVDTQVELAQIVDDGFG